VKKLTLEERIEQLERNSEMRLCWNCHRELSEVEAGYEIALCAACRRGDKVEPKGPIREGGEG